MNSVKRWKPTAPMITMRASAAAIVGMRKDHVCAAWFTFNVGVTVGDGVIEGMEDALGDTVGDGVIEGVKDALGVTVGDGDSVEVEVAVSFATGNTAKAAFTSADPC